MFRTTLPRHSIRGTRPSRPATVYTWLYGWVSRNGQLTGVIMFVFVMVSIGFLFHN